MSNVKNMILIIFVIFILIPAHIAQPQTVIRQRDEKIFEMVKEISAERIKQNIEKMVSFKTRHILSSDVNKNEGIFAAQRWVKEEFDGYSLQSGGSLISAIDSFIVEPDGKRITNRTQLRNVTATLKGSDPNDDRIYIISGHLDSRAGNVMDSQSFAPGADDDASGVAVVMALAEVMSKRQFPATIIFAAVSGEEQGLYGSSHLAKKAKKEKWNLAAMLNNDMVGNSSSDGTLLKDNLNVRIFSEGDPEYDTEEMVKIRKYVGSENDGPSRQLARYIKEVGERYVDRINVKLIYRKDRYLRGGDHTPFNNEGFTAVRFCEMNENYYHQHQDVRIENGIQYGDLPEFVDFDYAAKIAGINLAVLANLALAPASPINPIIDTKELTNLTKLKWEEPKGRKPYGYYILMRETDQPLWQTKTFVKGTEAVLPYSKDNYLFAIQAVDDMGHESLPVIPYPVFK